MKTKMINSVASVLLVVAIIVSGIIGFQKGADASAADTDFSVGYSMMDHTTFRVKDNTTKVYVYPMAGPSRYYQIQGRVDLDDTTIAYCSSKCWLNTGTKYSFTNSVREDNKNMARLESTIDYYLPVNTTGKWSPDSIGTYTVVP